MTVEERMKMIDAKVESDIRKKAKEEEDLANETETLVAKIRELKPRIDDLIKLANYAKKKGIDFNKSGWGGHEGYDTGLFMSNTWSHVVGFINEPTIRFMGYMAGGACGRWNFATDGDEVFDFCGGETREPDISHLRHFVDRFPVCEEKFYAYIENKCKE